MNSVKFQDTQISSTATHQQRLRSKLRIKSRTQSLYNSWKKKKILRDIPNQGGEIPLQGKLQNTAKRNHS